jgi:enoyl-CoA hydratase/carnithine racemase
MDNLGYITIAPDTLDAMSTMIAQPNLVGIIVQRGTHEHAEELPSVAETQLLELLWNAPLPVAAALTGPWTIAQFRVAMCCHFRCVDTTFKLLRSVPGDTFARFPAGAIEPVPLEIKTSLIAGAAITCAELAASGYAAADQTAAELLTALTANRAPRLIRAIMTSINNSFSLDRTAALAQESLLFQEIAAKGALQ